MLAELALYLATPVPQSFRQHGLLRESVGLWSRGTRHRRAWAHHAARCRAVVARSIEALSQHRTVIVLGSGLLRDVPIATLVRTFERVILIDAVHLWPIRLRYALHAKVRFVTRDLTGMLDQIGGVGPVRRLAPLADLAADTSVDLVISANLLSQLALPIERAIDAGHLSEQGLPQAVVVAHLRDLAAFSARVCLLTDDAYSEIDACGHIVETTDLLHGIQLPDGCERWDWPVSPMGEEAADAAFVHHVRGYADWKRSQ